MLAIIEYGAGNQPSVMRAFKRLGIDAVITDKLQDLQECDGIVFPGVGASAQAMEALTSRGFDKALQEAIDKGKPLLGICLGCQILLDASAEGNVKALGVVQGTTARFEEGMTECGEPVRIPHMGWNSLKHIRPSRLFAGIGAEDEFYFVHSYYTLPRPDLILTTTTHGLEFCSAYGRDGLWGVQFHPEKSGEPGLRLLANFNEYCKEMRRCSPNA